MTSDAFERVRAALEEGGADFADNRQNHFKATCPAHADGTPSLGVMDKGDKVLLSCYAGCQNDEVVKAMGLEFSDLFDGELDTKDRIRSTLVRSYLYEAQDGQPWFWVDRYYPKTFRQRMPDVAPVRDLSDREETRRLGLKGRKPILYHLPRVERVITERRPWVWFLDGEKDVETAERHGLVATCPPGFAKWDERYAQMLRGAAGVILVVDQDKEKPDGTLGSGQASAVVAKQGFRSVGLKVMTVAPAAGKDLTDHFTAGFEVKDFVQDRSIYTRPRGLTAEVLADKDFPETEWVIEGALPAGLTVFAGPPKAGKSWTVFDLVLSVALGGRALGTLPTRQGSAIYLAREDTYPRLKGRMRLLMAPGEPAPSRLELIPSEQDWQGGEHGLASLTEWAEEVSDPRLVVIDTLQRVEGDMGEDRRSGVYAGEYNMMARYKQWADVHNCAVLVVHHDTKTKPDRDNKTGWMTDPFTQISGTRGITGAADTLWFLEAQRFSSEGRLHITGRDVPERSLELMRSGPTWTCASG